jgi:hypothetical protein
MLEGRRKPAFFIAAPVVPAPSFVIPAQAGTQGSRIEKGRRWRPSA